MPRVTEHATLNESHGFSFVVNGIFMKNDLIATPEENTLPRRGYRIKFGFIAKLPKVSAACFSTSASYLALAR